MPQDLAQALTPLPGGSSCGDLTHWKENPGKSPLSMLTRRYVSMLVSGVVEA